MVFGDAAGADATSTAYFIGFHCPAILCGHNAHTREALILHMRSHFEYEVASQTKGPVSFTKEKGRYICSACNRSTDLRLAFMEHLRHHTCKFPYQCGSCKERVKSIPEYRLHFNRQHQNELHNNLEKFLVVNGDVSVDKIASILDPNMIAQNSGGRKVVKRKRSCRRSDTKQSLPVKRMTTDRATSDNGNSLKIVGKIQSVSDNNNICNNSAVSRSEENSELTPSAVSLVESDHSLASVTEINQIVFDKELKGVANGCSNVVGNSSGGENESQSPIVESDSHIGSVGKCLKSKQLGTENGVLRRRKYGFANERFICFECPAYILDEADFREHIWQHIHDSKPCNHSYKFPSKPQSCAIVESLVQICKLSELFGMSSKVLGSSNTIPEKKEVDGQGIVNSIIGADVLSNNSEDVHQKENIDSTIGAVVKPETITKDDTVMFKISDIIGSITTTAEVNTAENSFAKSHSITSVASLLPSSHEGSNNADVKESKGSTDLARLTSGEKNLLDFSVKAEEMVCLRYNKNPLSVKCTRCSFTCNNIHQLSTHDESCKPGVPKNQYDFICPECKFSNKRKGFFTWHMEHHTSERTISFFSCSVCGRESSHRSPLERHIQSSAHGNDSNCKIVVSSEAYPYLKNIRRCPICNDGYAWTVRKGRNHVDKIFIDHIRNDHKLTRLAAYLEQRYGKFVSCPEVVKFPKRLLPTGCSITEHSVTNSGQSSNRPESDARDSSRPHIKPKCAGQGSNFSHLSNVVDKELRASIAIDKYHCDNCEFSTDDSSAYAEHSCNDGFNSTSLGLKGSLGSASHPSSIKGSGEPSSSTSIVSALSNAANPISFSASPVGAAELPSTGASRDSTGFNFSKGDSKRCNLCAFFCNNALIYKHHMKDHANYDSLIRGYRCGLCSYTHPKLANAKDHVLKFHWNTDNPFVLKLPGSSKVLVKTSDISKTVPKSTESADKREQATLQHDLIYRTMCKAPKRKACFDSARVPSSKKKACKSVAGKSLTESLLISSEGTGNSRDGCETNEDETRKVVPSRMDARSNLKAATGSLLLGPNVQKPSGLSFQLWDATASTCTASNISNASQSEVNAGRISEDAVLLEDEASGSNDAKSKISSSKSEKRTKENNSDSILTAESSDMKSQLPNSSMPKYRCKYCTDFEPTHLLRVVKHHVLIVHLQGMIYRCPLDGCTHSGTNGSASVIVKHVSDTHGAVVTSAECLAPELDRMFAVENRFGVILIAFTDTSGNPILDTASLKEYKKGDKTNSTKTDSNSLDTAEHLPDNRSGKWKNKKNEDTCSESSKGNKDGRKPESHGNDGSRLGLSDSTLREAYSRFQGLKSISSARKAESRTSSSDERSAEASSSSTANHISENKQKGITSSNNSSEGLSVESGSKKKSTTSQKHSASSVNEIQNSESEESREVQMILSDSASETSLSEIMNLPENDCREKLNQFPPEMLTEIITTTVKTLQLTGLREHLISVIDNFPKQAGESEMVQQIKSVLESELGRNDQKVNRGSSSKDADNGEGSANKKTKLSHSRSKQTKTKESNSKQNWRKPNSEDQDESSDSDRGSSISSRSTNTSAKRTRAKVDASRKADSSKKFVGTKNKSTAVKSTGSKTKIQKGLDSIKRENALLERAPSPCSSTFSECSEWSASRSVLRLYCHLCTYSTTSVVAFAQHMKREFGLSESEQNGSDNKKRKDDQALAPMRHLCGFCSYSTYLQEEFDDHLRTHTQTKPFRCGYCSYTGFNPYAVKRHQRSVHKDKPELIVKIQENRPTVDQNSGLLSSSSGSGSKFHNGIDLQPRVVLRNVTKLNQRNIKMLLFRYDLDKINISF